MQVIRDEGLRKIRKRLLKKQKQGKRSRYNLRDISQVEIVNERMLSGN